MRNKEIPHKQSGTNACVITHVRNAHNLTAVSKSGCETLSCLTTLGHIHSRTTGWSHYDL